MRAIAIALITTLLTSTVFASDISQKSCEKYLQNDDYAQALETITGRMKTTVDELCTLERLFDVYIVNTSIYNIDKRKDEPHVWVTLHYAEHSCQYFVRNEDWVVTKKGCYNTF